MNRLPAHTGWIWLKSGFATFRRQPGFLSMLVFTNMLIALLLSGFPLLGQILPIVFMPAFAMAIQEACHLVDDGKRIGPAVLLTGFRREVVWPLARLGLIYFGVFVLLFLIVAPWIYTTALQAATQAAAKSPQGAPDPKMLAVIASNMTAIMGFMVMAGMTILALSFAPGLTYWKQMPTFKAIFYSFFAVIGSIKAFATMVLAWMGIQLGVFMVAALLFGQTRFSVIVLVWLSLIFTLVIQCAIYAAYKQIIGAPEEPPAPLKEA